tara:strand:+ start:157 stop:411 length:255 start_codon:yes stop_codon:yes gene_type:complete
MYVVLNCKKMKIDYTLKPKQQADLFKKHFLKCIVNHQRTRFTDNLDATTFKDEERIALSVIDILHELDGNTSYWGDVSRCIEND